MWLHNTETPAFQPHLRNIGQRWKQQNLCVWTKIRTHRKHSAVCSKQAAKCDKTLAVLVDEKQTI